MEQIVKKRKGEKWQNESFDPSSGQKEKWRNSGTLYTLVNYDGFRWGGFPRISCSAV